MTRDEAEELVSNLEEWLDLRNEIDRWQPKTKEHSRAILLSEAARERLINKLVAHGREDGGLDS